MLDMRKDFMMIKLCNIYDTMASMYLRHEVLILNIKKPHLFTFVSNSN